MTYQTEIIDFDRVIKPRSRDFDTAFLNVIKEHPSFWDDAEQDFKGAVELVKNRMIEEESEK